MTFKQMLVAGAGIGGLAVALACAKTGWQVRVLERATALEEVGAGIQLGPNVTRILHSWGLATGLADVAAFPEQLQVCSAQSGVQLGVLPLGGRTMQRYGAPYATIHRADLQQLLLQAVQQHADVELFLGRAFHSFSEDALGVTLIDHNNKPLAADVLVGADGLWSQVRHHLLGDAPPCPTGHLAYRALVRQTDLPAALRSQQVTVWLGPQLHVVQYPVCSGDALNIVAVVHDHHPSHTQAQSKAQEDWSHSTNAVELQAALLGTCPTLHDLLQAVPQWRQWIMHARPPLRSAHEMAQGYTALLGDAAHPMSPYLAQGAGMAIEDAAALAQALDMDAIEIPLRLRRYALNRWQRCAKVQARAARNGEIFHAQGPLRWGRDLSIRLLGARLLDVPWLYGDD